MLKEDVKTFHLLWKDVQASGLEQVKEENGGIELMKVYQEISIIRVCMCLLLTLVIATCIWMSRFFQQCLAINLIILFIGSFFSVISADYIMLSIVSAFRKYIQISWVNELFVTVIRFCQYYMFFKVVII